MKKHRGRYCVLMVNFQTKSGGFSKEAVWPSASPYAYGSSFDITVTDISDKHTEDGSACWQVNTISLYNLKPNRQVSVKRDLLFFIYFFVKNLHFCRKSLHFCVCYWKNKIIDYDVMCSYNNNIWRNNTYLIGFCKT